MSMFYGKLSQLSLQLGEDPIDVFVCSSSFEERCKSIVDHLESTEIRQAIVAYNENFGDLVAKNLEYLHNRLGTNQCQPLALDTNNPIKTGDRIAESIESCLLPTPQRFVIDTTTFTRESLLILIRCLKQYLKDSDCVRFLYAHAKEYSIGDPFEDKWLSKGIREVRSVLGYPGDLLPSRQSHLIILVGFEDERALSLIRECEPSRISLGVGDEAEMGTLPHQKTNVHRFDRLKSFLGSVEQFTFKGYDADATKEVLKQQIAAAPDFNTIIAPMNTKISTLGAAALALEDESIQLCYAQANIYNYARYSIPDDDFYLFTLLGIP